MKPSTKEPTPPLASNVDGSTQSLEVEEVLEPLNFEKSASVVLDVTRSLEKQFMEEEEEEEEAEKKG